MRREAFTSPGLPYPGSIRTYYPQVKIPSSFKEAVKPFGEARIFLYGSSATGERPSAFDPAKKGEVDLIIVTSDSREVYERMRLPDPNISHFQVNWPRNPEYRATLTLTGFSYHRGVLVIDGHQRPAKIAVTEVMPAINHLRGGRSLFPTSLELSKPWLHLIADRFEKPMVIQIQPSHDPKLDAEFDLAVNEARIRAAYFTLGKLHNPFSQAEFVLRYARKSYDSADIRQNFGLEGGRKAEVLVNQNPTEYYAMLDPILEGFLDRGFITRLGERVFETNIAPSQKDIKRWEQIAKASSLVAAGKYWFLDRGVVDGVKYWWEKKARREANGLYLPKA